MRVSVIIPTYNRASILKRCLQHIEAQTYSLRDIEVIVVDDGSTDDTAQIMQAWEKSRPTELHVTYLKQSNQGQGIARNLGISQATGDICLFIGDDILMSPHCVAEHVSFHRTYKKSAVLGLIQWHPELIISPFMQWLTNEFNDCGKFGGPQFAFNQLQHNHTADYRFFYTSNISIPTTYLRQEQFSDAFSCYGWEDIELGYRLEHKHDVVVRYNQHAQAYHHHQLEVKSLKKRMHAVGESLHTFNQLHPNLSLAPSRLKIFIFQLLSSPIALFALKLGQKIKLYNLPKTCQCLYFYALAKKYFLVGWNAPLRK